MANREEQRLVEQLVAHTTIEALDEPVLGRLARRNVMPLDAHVDGSGEHRVRGEFGAVVVDDHRGFTTFDNQIGQLAYDPPARDRRIHDRPEAFARDIVDDVEHAEPPAGHELVVDEI